MSPPRRALISITSATAPLHFGNPTGMFISEAVHPFEVFRAAGFEVDIVSEKGTYTLDWLSQQPDFYSAKDRATFEDEGGEFRKKLDLLLTPDKVDAADYGIFFASAGHAALIDYPTAKGLQSLATKIYANGGIMSSVCHGPAIYPGVIDEKAGDSVIKGKTITGFTTEGEYILKIMDVMKTWKGVEMVEEIAARLGAKYDRPKGAFDSFHVSDGRVITGTNPASALETAKAVVEAFEKL